MDTSTFQLTPQVSKDGDAADLAEEARLLAEMRQEAETFIRSFCWAPPIKEMLLAFGASGVLALYLVRFEHEIEDSGDGELWVVVGDVPSIYFVTDDASTPAWALETYCELADDWANAVLRGGNLSEVYPVAAEPTREHAEMLLSRISFIRERIIAELE